MKRHVFALARGIAMFSLFGATADADAATQGVPAADLSITVSDGVTTVNPGELITYTIRAQNAGPDPVVGAIVDDTFPTGVICGVLSNWTCSGTGGGTCTATGTGDIHDPVNLPAGAAVQYTVPCFVSLEAPLNFSNTATITSAVTDPVPANNSATDAINVIASIFIVAQKRWSGTPMPGGVITYTIRIITQSNTNQTDNPGDEFVDALPPGLILQSAIADAGTVVADLPSNTVTWNGGTTPGSVVTITIQAQVASTADGPIANQGTLSYDANADGSNDTIAPTDDPTRPGVNNPTVFNLPPRVPIPALTPMLAVGLLILIALTGAWTVRMRRH
ncbi:hypothetical protein C7S18_00825 [Ahniella affigens]|uniref:DUF11 domain-containing protein n=1 Tax=Ahniella affigens TaxID=2021234 RepID=A0A2P1PLW4_9GAMM|nr:DUF11 domain-containing protein [Ahniella affigens]AVP95830.1 hypothetical protein C7S18_00825 [Ahniella affigens]